MDQKKPTSLIEGPEMTASEVIRRRQEFAERHADDFAERHADDFAEYKERIDQCVGEYYADTLHKLKVITESLEHPDERQFTDLAVYVDRARDAVLTDDLDELEEAAQDILDEIERRREGEADG